MWKRTIRTEHEHGHSCACDCKLDRILERLEAIMSAVSDLKTAVAQVLQDISDETTELSAAVQRVVDLLTAAGVDNPDVTAAVTALQGTHQAVVDAVAAAENVLNPPVPAPAKA